MDAATLEAHPHVVAFRKVETYKRLVDGEMMAIAAAKGAAATDSAAYLAARGEAERKHASAKPTSADINAGISGQLMVEEFTRTGGRKPRHPLDALFGEVG